MVRSAVNVQQRVLETAQLVVREAQGKSGAFDYFICGVRRGYEQHEVIRTKR